MVETESSRSSQAKNCATSALILASDLSRLSGFNFSDSRRLTTRTLKSSSSRCAVVRSRRLNPGDCSNAPAIASCGAEGAAGREPVARIIPAIGCEVVRIASGISGNGDGLIGGLFNGPGCGGGGAVAVAPQEAGILNEQFPFALNHPDHSVQSGNRICLDHTLSDR